MMEDNKKPKMPIGMEAKMDVVKALRKLAMDMMAEDADDEQPAGVVAELEMKKVEDTDDMGEAMAEAMGEEDSEDMEDEDETSMMTDEELEELLKSKTKMLK